MTQFVDLANKSSIIDVLSTPTETKTPSESTFKSASEAISEVVDEVKEEIQTQLIPEEEPENKMTAEESAEALVAMLEGIVSPLFTALHYRKFKKQFSPEQKKLIDLAEGKPVEERTDEEKSQLGRWERLEREMKARIEDVGFTDKEYSTLIKPGALMCKKHNLDIPPSLAFALVGVNVISNRIIDLVAS